MILLDNIRLCIVTPPKTGSTSLHYHLCRPPYTGMCVIGPQFDIDTAIEKHTHHLPWRVGHRNYQVACVTRDPQARAISIWNHARRFSVNSYLPDFNKFLERKLITGNYKFGAPLSMIYGEIEFDAVIRLERLVKDLKALNVPIKTKIQKMNEHPVETPEIDPDLLAQWITLDTISVV